MFLYVFNLMIVLDTTFSQDPRSELNESKEERSISRPVTPPTSWQYHYIQEHSHMNSIKVYSVIGCFYEYHRNENRRNGANHVRLVGSSCDCRDKYILTHPLRELSRNTTINCDAFICHRHILCINSLRWVLMFPPCFYCSLASPGKNPLLHAGFTILYYSFRYTTCIRFYAFNRATSSSQYKYKYNL